MTTEQLNAWIQSASVLASAGVAVGRFLHGWIGEAHPSLTAEEQQTAYAAIIADDTVRAAFAAQAAGPTSAGG